MACVIANVNLLVCKPYAENLLSTMQHDIMSAFTTRLTAFVGFQAFWKNEMRLQANKTQPVLRGELSSLG